VTATDLMVMQARATKWHRGRFPDAKAHEPLLKAVEELGELAGAYLATVGTNTAHADRGGEDWLAEESADVVICLLVFLGRFVNHELGLEVHKKLLRLENPDSGHPAAARP
jgi:hypothetical protein